MTRTRPLHVGDVVRLRRRNAETFPRQFTTVRALMSDVEGGVWLNEALEWSRGWNVEDLEVRRRKRWRLAHI